jgi:4-hydroxy-tetrahydrodipicolinate synthase
VKIEGLYTALITPFNKGKIDEKGFCALVQRQIDAGVDGVFVLSSTGETPTLTEAEQEHLARLTIKQVKGRVPVLVGTGHYSTETTIEKTKKAKKLGADAAVVVTPYYNRPTQKGLYQHFEAITKAVDLPIVIYNIPIRTAVNIEPLTLCEIAQLRNIVSVKEANMPQVADIIHHLVNQENKFTVMSSDDINTLPLMALGGHGIISVVSNLVPEVVLSLVRAMEANRLPAARKVHEQLMPLLKGIFLETNPIGIKEAMNYCGLASAECRLPMCEMSKHHVDTLHRLLKDFGLGKKKKARS